MKKRIPALQALYYLTVPAVLSGFLFLLSRLTRSAGGADNPGAVIAAVYGFLLGLPILTAALMRFSLLPWLVDPFAAAEAPLTLIGALIAGQAARAGFPAAFRLANAELTGDGGMGVLYLIGLFAFGLLFSLSFRRRRGESAGYRLTALFSRQRKGPQPPSENVA